MNATVRRGQTGPVPVGSASTSPPSAFIARIFVDLPSTEAGRLATELATHTSAELFDIAAFGLPDLVCEVGHNPDNPRFGVHGDPWLYFSTNVEVFAEDDDASVEAIASLRSVVEALASMGCSFVTASDFEDVLPNRGRSIAID